MGQELQASPNGFEMIMMGDVDARLGVPRDKYDEDLATMLVYRGLVNITDRFLPRKKYRGSGSCT